MCLLCRFFFFKQKTAYEMRISEWSSDVCSSDLRGLALGDAETDSVEDRQIAIGVTDLLQYDLHDGYSVLTTLLLRHVEMALDEAEIKEVFRLHRLVDQALLMLPGELVVIVIHQKTALGEMGRAECRERVCQAGKIWEVDEDVKKKRQ